MELTYQNRNSFNPLPIFVLMGIVVLVIVFVLPKAFQDVITPQYVLEQQEALTIEQIRILEVFSGHSWESHGKDVNKVFNCFRDNGSTKSFKTSGFVGTRGEKVDTNLWLCFDGKDWYALVTTAWGRVGGNQVARLITAYRIAKDIFPTLDDYIKYITEKWGAYPISYIIEAGQMLLEPR